MKKLKYLVILALLLPACSGPHADEAAEGYPIAPVPFTSVVFQDAFWAPRIAINHEVTIPIAIGQSLSTGRIKNFEIAGGRCEGDFCTQYPFDDSDIYKIIEAASYSIHMNPDPGLESRLDSLIAVIAAAQEDDGYICTNWSIAEKNHSEPHPWMGESRWELVHELSHELYNLGHMFEAAVAHYQATGKRNLLDIAIKAADLLCETFGWGKMENYPGHQEVELGLVKLSLVTGERRYLELARFFLDVRGPGGPEYAQAHEKVVDQEKAVGHAVRAGYMYAAMADIGALYGVDSYIRATRAIWEDMVYTKTYVTGGIGASGGNEGFSRPYHLPNMSAYCETCASVAYILWNHRMFLYDGESKYIDVLERSLYNALLSGVSLSGDRFFYPNVLESEGQHERRSWFGCACCPPNIARLLPSLPGLMYAQTSGAVYVNLYAQSTAELDMEKGSLEIIQETAYPWEGRIKIRLNPEHPGVFELKLRIPGWARNEVLPGKLYTFRDSSEQEVGILINGQPLDVRVEQGYASIRRKWRAGDRVQLDLPMEARVVLADERVEADRNRMAFQRGPLVYALEWPETRDGRVLNLLAKEHQDLAVIPDEELLGGINCLEIELQESSGASRKLRMIPYYAWNNRGPGEMAVWLPIQSL